MRAAVYRSGMPLGLEERAVPEPGPGEVRVQVVRAGVCGTDRHILEGGFPARSGVILGHETTGIVHALGPGVEGLSLGEGVALDPNRPCHRCPACRAGRTHLCANLESLGVTRDGGFAPYVVAPAVSVYGLAPGLTPVDASLAEPLSCCVHGVDVLGPRLSDRALVLGLGAIGLMIVQLLRAHGVAWILGADPDVHRRRAAASLLDGVMAPEELERSRVGPVELVVEASGTPTALTSALALVDDGGSVLQFGVMDPAARVALSPYDLFRREIRLVGAFTNPQTFARAIDALARRIVEPATVLGDDIGLDELPAYLDGTLHPAGLKHGVRFPTS